MSESMTIERADGRRAFGENAAGYAAGRPDYPEEIYETLRSRCGLGPGTATFEMGPATGLVTRRLAALGADPLVAIEPDERLADHLAGAMADAPGAFELRRSTFEEAPLEQGAFDLGVSATAFHWVEQRSGLQKVALALRPGGWWAMWWNVFGDPREPDPFHEATVALLKDLGESPSAGVGGIWPFALQREERLAELGADGLFEDLEVEEVRTNLTLDGGQVRKLYATFSSITALARDRRERLLDELVRIAKQKFAGQVDRKLVTPLYTARRTTAQVPE